MLLTALCCSTLSVGQSPYFYTINDEKGLPSNEVYTVRQDNFGYMWIGCNAGLYKYDGFRFLQFKNIHQNGVAISGLKITNENEVFCQNFYGQLFFTRQDSLMLCADVKEQINTHPEYTVDSNNTLWIGLPKGIQIRTKEGNTSVVFKELSISEIELSARGEILLVDINRGLLMLQLETDGTYKYRVLADKDKILRNSRSNIKVYNGKTFLLCSSNSTNVHYLAEISDDSLKVFKRIEKNSLAEFIYNFALLDGKYWLATSNGVYCLDANGAVTSHIFIGEKITDIYRDKEHAIWFPSLQNGIHVMPSEELMLLNGTHPMIKDDNFTSIIRYTEGSILIGTYTGDIYRFSPLTREVEVLPKNNRAVYRNVTSIIPYDAQTIITSRGGISIINTVTNSEKKSSSVYVRDMTLKGDSVIYVSTNGISYISDIKNKITTGSPTKPALLCKNPGKMICYDTAEKKLWVALNEGLALINDGKPKQYLIDSQEVFCSALYCDHNGLWVGTISDGVYNIKNEEVILHLTQENGLVGNNIKCITSVSDTVYIATDECIYIYYPDKTHRHINYADGINTKEVSAIEVCNPFIYLCTVRGLFYIPVTSVGINNIRPKIKITSVICDGNNRTNDSVILLKYNNKDIVVNFSSVLLRSRGRFRYLYRIAGLENNWTAQDGAINSVRLNHLPAGKFVFEVKSVNEDGIPSENTARAIIEVAEPIWQQWWFYTLITLLASTVVALAFIQRIRNLKKKSEILNQITSSQLTALKAQMNPHFMYNTLNSIQDLVLQKDIKSTNYYLSRYSSLMRKILDTSEHNEIELIEEVEILNLYLELEQLRFGNDFKYHITLSDEIEPHNIYVPSMIIQPFVENAIKHGLLHKKGNKTVSINFILADQKLICTITDNGVGREKSAAIKKRSPLRHQSFATKATEKRLTLINLNRRTKITLSIIDLFENNLPSGTEVRVEIPLI